MAIDADWTRLPPPGLVAGLAVGVEGHEDDPVRRRRLVQTHAVECGRPEVRPAPRRESGRRRRR